MGDAKTQKKVTKAQVTKKEKKAPEKKTEKTQSKSAKKEFKNKNKLKKSEKKHSKKYREVEPLIEKGKVYSKEEGIELVKKTSTTKFDSSVELHISLGLDIKKADQQIRGSVTLPNGTGKSKKVLAIVGADKEKEAKESGADFFGGKDMVQKIEKGWLDFDIIVATPDMIGELGKTAKILGPKGLMPNPKIGTVTPDIAKVVKNIKAGMVEYKTDSFGIVHQSIGKVSFDDKKLLENYEIFLDTILKAKPQGAKGTYIKSIYLTSTMGPSIKIAL